MSFQGADIHSVSLKGERFLRPTPRMNYTYANKHHDGLTSLGDRLTDTMRPLTSKYIPASLHFL